MLQMETTMLDSFVKYQTTSKILWSTNFEVRHYRDFILTLLVLKVAKNIADCGKEDAKQECSKRY